MTLGFPLVAIIVVIAVVLLLRERDPARRASILQRAGFIVMAVPSLLFALFVVGETFMDPGGWEALALVAAWAIPLAALAALVWFRPDPAVWVLAVLIGALIGVSIWFALDPGAWEAFEDRNGPIRDVAMFAVTVPVALLGLKRTRAAGLMLLVLGIVPLAIMSLGSLEGFVLLVLVTSPAVIAGVLYLLSAMATGRAARGTAAGPEVEPSPV